MSLLLPDWCEGIHDAPWTILHAMDRANLIIHLTGRGGGFRPPPRRMWLNDERLSDWVKMENERLERVRKGEEDPDTWQADRVDGPAASVQTQDVEALLFSDDAPVPG